MPEPINSPAGSSRLVCLPSRRHGLSTRSVTTWLATELGNEAGGSTSVAYGNLRLPAAHCNVRRARGLRAIEAPRERWRQSFGASYRRYALLVPYHDNEDRGS